MEKELIAVLATTLNKSEDEVAGLLKKGENGTEIDSAAIISLYGEKRQADLDAVKIEEQKKADEKADNYFSRGIAEARKTYALPIKDLFGLEIDVKDPQAYIEAVKNKREELASKRGSEDLDIETLPEYIQKQNEWTAKITDLEKEKLLAVQEVENKYIQKEVFSKVSDKALGIFDTYDFITDPERPEVLTNNRREFINRINRHKYQVAEDGSVTPLNEEGKRLEDAHGNPITFEMIAKNNIEGYIPQAKAKPRNSGGGSGGSEGGYKGKVPQNEAEYTAIMTKMIQEGTPIAERTALTNAYNNK